MDKKQIAGVLGAAMFTASTMTACGVYGSLTDEPSAVAVYGPFEDSEVYIPEDEPTVSDDLYSYSEPSSSTSYEPAEEEPAPVYGPPPPTYSPEDEEPVDVYGSPEMYE